MVEKKNLGLARVETLQQKDRRRVNMIQRIENDCKMLAVAVANGVKKSSIMEHNGKEKIPKTILNKVVPQFGIANLVYDSYFTFGLGLYL